MRYKVFTRQSIRTTTPRVTINPNGRIYLNQGAASFLLARKAAAVLLLWDEDIYMAAIKPINKADNRAYRIAYSHKGSGASITAKSFLDWIGFDDSDPALVTVDAEWDENKKILEFEIPETRLEEQ